MAIKIDLTNDDVLYVLMSFGALFNSITKEDENGKKNKLYGRSRWKIRKAMAKFIIKYRKQCEEQTIRFKNMTEDEKSLFFANYQIEDYKKEIFQV